MSDNFPISPCKKTSHIRTSARRKGPLPKKAAQEAKDKFLASFAENGIVRDACLEAGIDRSAVRYWEEHDEQFSMQYNLAKEDANDALRAVIVERAKAGSDLLLMFHAKARMPEYRDKQQVAANGKVIITTRWGGGSLEDLEVEYASTFQ